MPEVVTASLEALAGNLAIIESVTPDGMHVRAVVTVAGLTDVTFYPGGLDQAWEVLAKGQHPLAILEAGSDGHLPLVEPYVAGEPLGAYLRSRHLIRDPGAAYALAPVGTAVDVPWPFQLMEWVESGLVITVGIFAILLLGIRDRQVKAELAKKDPHPRWYKRLFRWFINPAWTKPVKLDAPNGPPPTSDQA